jgi:hypothetical protein
VAMTLWLAWWKINPPVSYLLLDCCLTDNCRVLNLLELDLIQSSAVNFRLSVLNSGPVIPRSSESNAP